MVEYSDLQCPFCKQYAEGPFAEIRKDLTRSCARISHSQKAIVAASGVARFVIYDLRHACLTRWSKTMDPFTVIRLAGHVDLNTTMRYVHLNDADVRAKMGTPEVDGGHKIGRSDVRSRSPLGSEDSVFN